YSFDEGTGTRVGDSSGNGNHGTAIGGPTWSTGVLAGAMTFDGVDDYVDCGKGASVTNVGSVSVAVWIQPGVAGQDIKIASDQDGANGGYKLGVYSGNSMVEFEVRTSANAATLNRTAPGGTALEAGVWYHVVGVYEKGKAIRTYVNGRLDRELLTTVEAGVSQGALMLGREAPTGAYWWNGKMDDMRIYNIAMSDAEAAGLAGQTEPIHKPF
ncbi:MAG: LamG domain-containing protein, partial [Phycisphaerales bacterium]